VSGLAFPQLKLKPDFTTRKELDMDLKDLTPINDTVNVPIVHPTTLTVYAPHAKEYKKAVFDQTNRRLKQAQGKRKVDVTAEDLNITYNKEQPKFSVDKAKEIYSEVFWIRDQIEEAVSNSLDFTKA